MKRTPNWKELDLIGKCGSCKFYKQKIIDGKFTARGNCLIKGTYVQRTETCKKYEGAVVCANCVKARAGLLYSIHGV